MIHQLGKNMFCLNEGGRIEKGWEKEKKKPFQLAITTMCSVIGK